MKTYQKILMFAVVLFVFIGNNFAQIDLTNGLVFHLPLDNNTNDVSSNNLNGTGQHVQVSANRFGSKMKAAEFHGAVSNGMISMGSPLLNNQSAYSMSYWFRIDNNTNAMSLVGQDNCVESGYYTNPNRVIVFHPNSGSFSFAVPNPTQWNHVVLIGNNTNFFCYLNGVLVRTENGNFSAVNTNFNFNIAGNVVNQSNNTWLRGAIDDVRLYNRVLTVDEVTTLFNANSVSIEINSISSLNLCAGADVSVNFSATGNILPGNEYLLEISDLNGNFVDNIEIGKLVSSAFAGNISGTIPQGMPSGGNYKLRVSSTNVMSSGTPSSQDVNIQGTVGDIPNPSLFRYIGESSGRQYYRSLAVANFNTANNNCLANGGHLANIGNQNDQNLLYSYIIDASGWFGLTRTAGVFSWQNDFTTALTNWQPGQPASFNEFVMRLDNGRWNGVAPNEARHYFMQLEPAGLNINSCVGNSIDFSPGEINGANYTWSGPNGFNANESNPTINSANLNNAGIYQLTIENGGCVSAPFETVVEVNALSENKPTGSNSTSVCLGSTAQIFVAQTEADYLYSLHNANTLEQIGSSQTGNGDTLFFTSNILTENTNYLLRATDPNTGCQRDMDDHVSIQVWALPIAPTVTSDSVCNAGNVTLTSSGAPVGSVYNWYTNANLSNLLQSSSSNTFTTDSLLNTTNFFATITDNNGCESASTQISAVIVNPLAPEIDLVTGLIIHYNLDGNTQDASGNNIHASIAGSNWSYVDDRFTNPMSALNLNGSTYTTSGNPPQVGALTNQVTVSFWIRQTPSNWGFTTPLLNKWQNNGLFVGLNSYLEAPNQPHQNRVRWRVNNGTVVNSNTNVPFNQWVHIVCTYNGSQLRVFQNGILTGQANHTGLITNTITNLEFGRQANLTSNTFYRGDVDDIRLYNRALTPAEIQALFDSSALASSNAPICEGEDLQLSAFTFADAEYSWSGPNGFVSSEQNPIIPQADSTNHSGTYELSVTRYGCTSIPQQVSPIINSTPEITSVVNDTICGPGEAFLQAFSNNPDAEFYWYTQAVGGTPIAGQNSNTFTISNVSQNTTRYVSVKINTCESERVPVSVIYSDPANTNLNLSGAASNCQTTDYAFTLQNSELGVNYTVILNGNPSGSTIMGTGNNLNFVIPAGQLIEGNNVIQLDAHAPGCSSVTLINSLQVLGITAPQAVITSSTGDNNLCQGSTITLSANDGASFVWNTGAQTNSIQVNNPGMYSVEVTYANGCSSNSAVFELEEVPTPTPTIQVVGSSTICEGETVTLQASGGQSYLWSNGMTGSSIVVGAAGSYSVTAFQGNCEGASSPVNITVNAIPTPTIQVQGSNTICEGETVTLQASGGQSYLWSNGMSGSSITVGAAGSYSVTAFQGDCQATSTNVIITVTPLPTPTIQAQGSPSICEGESVTLQASGGQSYLWSNGMTGSSITVGAAGSYSVTAFQGNCEATSAAVNITVNPSPTPSIQVLGSTTICEGESVSLQASGGQSYLWSNGMTGPNILVNTSGSYTVTAFEGACEGTSSSVQITVLESPNITIAASASAVCFGEQVQLSATGANNFSWSDGIQNGVPFTPESTTTYEVTGTNANTCEGTASITITVNPIPETSEINGPVSVACDTNSEVYEVENNIGSTYQWTVPAGAQIISGQGTHTVAINFNGNFGDVSVIETSAAGCLGDEQSLAVNCSLSLAAHSNYSLDAFPNPAQDLLNLSLTNNADRFEVLVYDNVGKLIFQGSMHKQIQIDVRALPQGLYNVVLKNEQNTLRTKFTKL